MSEQTLFPVPLATAKLTDRQAAVLLLVRKLGEVEAVEAGQLLHSDKHSSEQVCDWCASAGREVLKALRRKGLVKQRRGGGWTLSGRGGRRPHAEAGSQDSPSSSRPESAQTDVIPF